MEDIFEQNSNTQPARPSGLKTISILSFLGSGSSLVANLFVFLFYSTFVSYLSSDEIKEASMAFDTEMLKKFTITAGQSYFLISAILYSVSLFGVYLMWHLVKKGIHFYAIAQISLLLLPLLFIDSSLSILPGLILSGTFIFLYSRFLNVMK
jgi:hypothetical protein